MRHGEIPIFLAADDNYAPFLLTTILSVAKNTDEFCHFYILDGGIVDSNKEIIFEQTASLNNAKVEFFLFDTKKTKTFRTTYYLTKATYYRLFIADMFPNVDKAIYMDVDIIATGDISKLYDIELGMYILAAVPDQFSVESLACLKNNLGIPLDCTYFNAGVLLLDLEKWRKEAITKKLLALERQYRNRLLQNDQDVLNKFFADNYLILPMVYNSVKEISAGCVIRHYAGKFKPWNIPLQYCTKSLDDYAYFWKYMNETPFKNIVYEKYAFKSFAQVKFVRVMLSRMGLR